MEMTGKYMDYRYMATSDLLNELNKEGFKVDTDLEAKLANIVIQQLDDAAGDVSGLAIKCIALLVKKIREQHVLEITSRLCDKLLNGKEQNRDIANIALKTIVAEVPSSSVAHSVLVSISTKLIRGITTQGMGTEIKCECLDILCDLLHKYGNLMASDHEVLLGVLLPQLNTNEASVRKKTVSCIASLASSLSDDLLAKSTIEKALFDKLSTSNTSFDVLLDSLLSSAKSSIQTGGVAKQVLFAVAQCVAILCLTAGDKKCSSTVNLLTDILKSDSSVDSAKQHLSLLCLGEIGRKKDLSYHDNIENIIIESFNSPFEEINSAASYALGNIAVGNLPKYLPFILDKIDNQQKKQYLLLHSLKEIIVRQSIDKAEFDDSSIVKITSLLFNHCESDEESVRNVVAECLGKIALIEPGKLVPALKERTSNPVAFTRATVVLAVKYSIVERQEKIDEILYHEIASFLMLVKDHDRRVRCAAVLALRTAAHNKPNLIKGLLPEILPLLYDQTVIKKELIRTVDLGHFKHTVDDGLELRKAAFECVDTLLESCLDQVNPSSFIVPYLLSGLDDHYDVKMPCHLILSKLADMCPSAVLAVLDSLVNPLQKTINFRPKHDAVKQEVDHNEDMICSALRAIASLNCMRKVKILKAPKFDLSRLMEVHGDYSEDVGVKFERPSEYTVPAEGTEEGTSVLWGRISETRLVMTVDSRATKAIRVGRRQVRILTKDNAIKYHKFKGGIVTLCGNAKRCRDMLDHVRITLKNREMEENQANIVELGVQWFADNDLVDRRTATINVCQWIASNQAWNLVAFGDQYPDGACVKLIDGETLYGCGSGSQTAIRNLRSSQNPISFETFKEEIIRTSLRDLGTGGLGHVFCFETDGEISRETIDIMDFLCTAEDNFYATEVFSSNNFFIVTGVEDENAYTPFDLHEIAKRLFPRARFNNMSRWIRRTDHLIICLVKLHSVGQRQRMMDLFNPPPRTALPAVFNFTNTRSHNNRSKGLVALASPNFLFHARTAQNIYDLRLLCI